MKIVYLNILLLFMLGCKSHRLVENSIPINDNIGDEMHFQLRSFYLKNLKYPNLDEFLMFCWERTNSNYENRYKDFDAYYKDMNGNIPVLGPDSLMHFMMDNRKNLSFHEGNGELSIIWKPTSSLILTEEFSIQRFLSDDFHRNRLFIAYDKLGNNVVESDIEYLFREYLFKEVINKYQFKDGQNSVWCLIVYDENDGMKLLAPSNSEILDEGFVKLLARSIENYFEDNNVSLIRFPLRIPTNL